MGKIAIIGNGIAGITAARFIRKLSSDQILVISDESDSFFSRTALMYVYMGHLRWKDLLPFEDEYWKANQIERINQKVRFIDFESRTLWLGDQEEMSYDKLILACGSKSNMLDCPGIDLLGVRGFYFKQDLEYLEKISHKISQAVIAGGGLIGIELAEMLHSRNIPVTLLVREPVFYSNVLPIEEAKMISNHIRQNGIDLRLSTQLKEICGDDQNHVKKIITDRGESIDCNFVGITIGVQPNIGFLRNTGLACDKGILVNEFLETNIPGVYAIGDCAQLRNPAAGRKAIEAIWYSGRSMGETVASTISGRRKKYEPGLWFNSAKFFDLEYQVYGNVPANFSHPLSSFYWESGKGFKSIRIVFDKENKTVKGFNLIGIRFRQEVCEKWIRHHTQLDEVISNIRLAFFDPEFFEDVAPSFLKKYNTENNKSISLKSPNSLNAVLHFLKS